ncbi:MFS transporter [Aquimarina sp. TRL1]|uniref:peptide MFS transporter n=1 Tax=Aquimarina sp. (strain TRL1) TaxID=2736252 RepID=UPI00158D5846|nr:oligopeptide:H+ symporter [Aquimarina sp. TRL1]QKX05060.1 MFS transporter [Aquimarina sp. TRL1]
MNSNITDTNDFFKDKVLGHPAGLFVLFFTEMWERFSFYGMRALLVLFFTASLFDEGWGWPREHASALFGSYVGLVYLSTMLGGYFADKIIGFRWAVVVGALLMTLGHGAMAVETPFFIYMGLGLLVFGNGFFKPNMTSIISEMYKNHQEKKDGAYTIFYMGVNAGAFFGILLCGYLGEKIGWSYGFGLAGIFMLFGLIQFWLAQNIFGDIGLKPKKEEQTKVSTSEEDNDKRVPFSKGQLVLITICSALGILWILNDPAAKISEGAFNIFDFQMLGLEGNNFVILTALVLFLGLLIYRLTKYSQLTKEKLIAVTFFAFLTIFFWAIFEQSPNTLTVFAKDYTDRVLEGTSAYIFKVINTLIAIVPLGIITWVLWLLFKQTFAKYKWSNIILATSFVIVWGVTIWMISNEFKASSYNVTYSNVNGKTEEVKIISSEAYKENDVIKIKDIQSLSIYDQKEASNGNNKIENGYLIDGKGNQVGECLAAKVVGFSKEPKPGAFGTTVNNVDVVITNSLGESVSKKVKISSEEKGELNVGDEILVKIAHSIKYDLNQTSQTTATISSVNSAVEIPASWFSILNSLFIIAFAPLFSKWWESKYNPSANMKYGIGMFLLAIGMACVAFGANGIEPGAKTASVSIIWLILVYLFHTMGELCISPVGLSYVSKLVPARMIAFMFGVWYLAVAIGMKGAGKFGENIDKIADTEGISYFFWMLTIVSVVVGAISILFEPIIKKLMHGVR